MRQPKLVHAWFHEGVWRARVSDEKYVGEGQSNSLDHAIAAALDDFEWLQPSEK